ncbi:restriction endonuclease subunit S [Neisseria sp.]
MNKQQEPRLRFKNFTGAWEEKKVIDFSPLQRGFDLPVSKITEGDYPVVFSNGILKSHNQYKVKGVGIVTGRSGTIGEVTFVEKDFWPHNTALWVTNFFGNNPQFVFHFLKNFDLSRFATGSGVPTLNRNDVHNQTIYVPKFEEQTALGNFFRRLDSQIAESRAVLEKSRQLKKAMLAKMFPADGEKIPKIRFKGFEGEWECRKLGAEVEIVGGGTPDTTNSTYWNGDIDWYSPTEIGEAAYANGSVKKITLLGLQKSSAQILPANRTVLFTSRASIGDMAILTKDGSTNQGFQSFVVGERLDVYFFYTMGFKIKDYALKNASGSTFLEISKNTLSQMEFFAPSLKEQTAIGLFFRQLDETIALQSAEVEKLNQLKKGLLAAMLV